ncbi:MAG: hypothetical protein JXB50_07835 [Spirochaetes bacterium]|nr:hypothetical protein [Spirochaetota bacterium]
MIADEFCKWLENNGFGSFSDNGNIFDNFQPNDPDNQIAVYDYQAPSIPESSSLSVDQIGIRIVARNNQKQEAKRILMEIHKSFIGFGGSPLIAGSDNIVTASFVDIVPYGIGKDDNNRHEYTVSYRLRITTIENAYRL